MNGTWNMAQREEDIWQKPAISSVWFFIYCFSPVIEISNGWVKYLDWLTCFQIESNKITGI